MYKKIVLSLFTFCVVLISACSSSNNDSENLEAVGAYTFDFLQNMTEIKTMENRVSYFAKTKDINKCLTESVKGERVKNRLYDMVGEEQSEYPSYVGESINKLRVTAASYGIEWNKIVFLDYVVFKKNDEEPPYKADLFFKYGDSVFLLHVLSFNLGDDYYLADISNLRKVN